MKWYSTSAYSDTITEREMTRDTEQSVFFLDGSGKERRELKESGSMMWHRTREEALTYLLQLATKRIEMAERQLSYQKIKLEQLLFKYPELNL